MKILTISWLTAVMCVVSPAGARAEPFSVSTTIATSGAFFCLAYAPCFTGAGTNQITIGSATGSATITFTGVDTTFDVTNSLSTVSLGRFDIRATDGFMFPTNHANPELAIIGFSFLVASLAGDRTGLRWTFGPGGGPSLRQWGPWDVSVQPDSDPAPFAAVNFATNSPVLEANGSALLTAEAGLVPEPSTLLLLGSGLAGGALARRRRRAQQQTVRH